MQCILNWLLLFSVCFRLLTVEWGVTENRTAVRALYKCGKRANEIYKLLKTLNISRFINNSGNDYMYRADQCQDLFELISTWKPTVGQRVIFWQYARSKLGSTNASDFFRGTRSTATDEKMFTVE